jgi:carboxypeptidase C (cathepsin A)
MRIVMLLATCARAAFAVQQDEPIVTTHHEVTIAGRTLRYSARAGRIPIRDNEAGDIHGRMFFVSYTLDRPAGSPARPLTFVWNGGPGSNAALVHLIGFGPKRIAPPRAAPPNETGRWIVEPNPGTWLDTTDLVFVDPIGTGYSRPTTAEYGREFYQTRGDAESVAELIRVYRTRFDAFDAPLFLAGESYGVTRAAGVAAALERRGTTVRGVILLGLALPLGSPPPAVRTALGLPSLTVAAFVNRKLAPDLQRDLDATMKEAETWAMGPYATALARRDSVTDAQRDSIVRALARFTGLDPTLIDRRTLTVDRMRLGNYLLRREGRFVGQYDSRLVGPLDTTQAPYDPTKDPSLQNLLDDVAVLRYLREELGFRSDLKYQGPFGGGYPPPTAFRGDWMSVKWVRAAEDSAAGERALSEAMRLDRSLRVLSACGIYDLVCDYYGNTWVASRLDPDVRRNVVAYAYPGGHAMYTDPRAHAQLKRDVARFIHDAVVGATAAP